MSAVTSCENALLVIFRFVWAVKFVLLDYKVANVADGGVIKLLDINSWISLKILRNKCAKFVFRAQWLVTVGSSWEVVGDSSLVQCKTRFVQIFYVFFFIEHIFVDPPPKLVPRSRSVLRRGRSGYEITSPFSLTHSLNYLWIPSVLSQLKLHCSCLKPLVLSNVVQGGSLSASFQDYYCCPKNPALIGKIMWSSELQSVTLLKFAPVLPTFSVLYVTNKDYICMVN